MAEEEEQLKDDILYSNPNTLISWERIQLPPLPTQFQSQSQPPVILLSDTHAGDGTWSTHKEHHTSVVFPPTDHEGLNLIHHCDVQEKLDERPKTSPPVSIGIKPAAIGGSVAVKWWFLGFKLHNILSWVWNLPMIRGILRSFNFPLIGSTVVVILFYLSCRLRRRRRRLREETVDGLLGVIKEKDERIHHLLQQIARLNELLLASHHGVPMISKASST